MRRRDGILTLGTNHVDWINTTTNDFMTSTPSCAGGYPVTGPDVVYATSRPLPVSSPLPSTNRRDALGAAGDQSCGDWPRRSHASPILATPRCPDHSPSKRRRKYHFYIAATAQDPSH